MDREPPPDEVPADEGEAEEEEATQDIPLDDGDDAAGPPPDEGEPAAEPEQEEEVKEEEEDPVAEEEEEEVPLDEPKAEAKKPPKDEYVDLFGGEDDDDEDPLSAALSAKPDEPPKQPSPEPEPEPEPEKPKAAAKTVSVDPPVVESQPPTLPVEPAKPKPAPAQTSAAPLQEPVGAQSESRRLSASPKRKSVIVRQHEKTLDVSVTNPERVGDGMSSYISYQVDTKTTMPAFRQPSTTVKHRYSEFLALYKYLAETYQGYIVAVCPPKDAIGTGIVKLKSSGAEITPFIERRAAALHRFMRRLCDHPVIREDAVLRSFLESEDKVPKPKTNVLATMAAKLSSFMESDEWFEDKQREVDTLDSQLKKLHAAAEALVARRKELSATTTSFAESFAALADAEEVEGLTKAMHQMADVEAKIAKLHNKHAARDFYDFGEIIHDYITLVTAIRNCFLQRIVAHKNWQTAELNLNKKREAEAKYQAQNKAERLDQAAKEVAEAEHQAATTKKEFEQLSERIRGELEQFDVIKVQEIQDTMVSYVEAIMTLEHQTVKAWEAFLPEAKSVQPL